MAERPSLKFPTVQPQGPGQDYLSTRGASPEAFGGLEAQAKAQGAESTKALGDSISKLGDVFTNHGIKLQEERNSADARELYLKGVAELDQLAVQQKTLLGKNAADAYPNYAKQVQDIQQKYALMAPNDRVKRMVGPELAARSGQALSSGALHAAEQQRDYFLKTNIAVIDQAKSQAINNPGDTMAWEQSSKQIEGALRSQKDLLGQSDEVFNQGLQKARGDVYNKRVELLGPREPFRMDAEYEANKNLLDADSRISIERQLREYKNGYGAEVAGKRIYDGTRVQAPSNLTAGIVAGERGKTGDVGPLLASGENALGKFQVLPSTAREVTKKLGIDYNENRLKNDDQYGELIASAYLNEQINKYRNVPMAYAAYNAGPGRVDQALKKAGDPRTGGATMEQFIAALPLETQSYIPRAMAAAGNPNSEITAGIKPTIVAALDQAKAFAAVAVPGDVSFEDRLRANIIGRTNQDRAIAGEYKATLELEYKSQLTSASVNGRYDPGIEQRLRIAHTDEPAVAEHKIQELKQTALFQTFRQSMASTTPDEDASMLESMKPGNAPMTPEALERYNLALQARDQKYRALREDPGGYVRQYNPSVADAFAVAQQDTRLLPKALAMSAQTQSQMGIPEEQQRYLGKDQAALQAKNITRLTGDQLANSMISLQGAYGDYWPQVLRELKSSGLPGEFNALTAMVLPEQVKARAALATMMSSEEKTKGTIAALTSKTDLTGLDENVALAFRPFYKTLTASQNFGDMAGFDQAGKKLAIHYIINDGMSVSAAATKAYEDITGAYEVGATARAPKGKLLAAEAWGESTLRGVKPETIVIPSRGIGEPPLTDQQRRDKYLELVKGGWWATNHQDDGWIRYDSNGQPVRLQSGNIEAARTTAMNLKGHALNKFTGTTIPGQSSLDITNQPKQENVFLEFKFKDMPPRAKGAFVNPFAVPEPNMDTTP